MAISGCAPPDPLFAPATGSATPSTAIRIVLPGVIDFGMCTTAGMSAVPVSVTTQLGSHSCVPETSARVPGVLEGGGLGASADVASLIPSDMAAFASSDVASLMSWDMAPLVSPNVARLSADVVARGVGAGLPVAVGSGTVAGVLTVDAGQSAESVTLAGSVSAAIVTFSALPAGSRTAIR
jgi:hypothetical protein